MSTRLIDRVAMAGDASHYLLTPVMVRTARDAADVGAIMRECAIAGIPLTFRSGGTSLSGQAVTDGVLVDTRREFRAVEVLDDGLRVRVQPGATLRTVNARLAPYGRKLGPDPASEGACTLGGVIANNSSGMACGLEGNAYRTLESVRAVLPSGTVVDTAAPDADEELRCREEALYSGLARLRDRIRTDPDSVRRITQQFSMKNTMGYALNAFLDHTRPVDILARLLVGSEGTLAFVAEAVLRTLPTRPHTATALVSFETLTAATNALPALVASGAATLELLDAASLRVGAADPAAPPVLRALEVDRHAALLVEYQELTADDLESRLAHGRAALDALGSPAALTADPVTRAGLWHVRKGLYAAVAGARSAGTTALLEDVVVPVPRLSHTCGELTRLFAEHGYPDAVIFGHAKDGNIHFMLTEAFDTAEGVRRYARFTDDMVDLVLGEHGSLKAEHGTGRVMAGHVRRQYGPELFDVMREVKRLFDPDGVLSPGVVLSDDPEAYLRDLKPVAPADPEVDRCVECGFCEPVCPSNDLTLTPRQRIAIRRRRTSAELAGEHGVVAEQDRDYAYDGVQTCAVDGMCQTACPVGINTGDLVRRLRSEQHSRLVRRGGELAATHWAAITRGVSRALDVAAVVPAVAAGVSRMGRGILGADRIPLYDRDLPRGGPRRNTGPATGQAVAVLFESCTGELFGAPDGAQGSAAALRSLCRKAGVEVTGVRRGLCCGTPWSSKGLTAGRNVMEAKVRDALLRETRGGALPVVSDAASCTEGLHKLLGDATVRVLDAVTFVHEVVLPRLTVHRRYPSIALHPTCSSNRLGVDGSLVALAAAIADDVVVPVDWSCCAFAGDRGLLHPELTASATRAEAAEVRRAAPAALASCNRTCEIGMTRAVGRPYRHLLELVDDAASAGPPLPAIDW